MFIWGKRESRYTEYTQEMGHPINLRIKDPETQEPSERIYHNDSVIKIANFFFW